MRVQSNYHFRYDINAAQLNTGLEKIVFDWQQNVFHGIGWK